MSLTFISFPSSSDRTPQGPLTNEGAFLSDKTLGHRLCTYLVLFSFLFQTLCPSVVFAADVEVLHPVPQSHFLPSHFLSKADQAKGHQERTGIEVGVRVDGWDEEDQPTTPKHPVFIPLSDTTEKTQHLVDHSFSVQALYPNLQVCEDGLTWQTQGYSFFLDRFSGNLLVNVYEDAQEQTIVRSPFLRLLNPHGAVVLGESLGRCLQTLLVKGSHVLNTGKSTEISRLEVWAEGDSSHPTGTFLNRSGASLSVLEMLIHKGQVENQGIVAVADGGIINLQGQDLLNHNKLHLGEGVRLEGGRVIVNGKAALMTGERYTITGQVIQNEGDIEGKEIALLAQHSLKNTKRIHGETITELTTLGDLENTGAITSNGEQVVLVQGNLSNAGTMIAPEQTVKVVGTTENSGMIKGLISLEADLNSGVNTGSIGSDQSAAFHIQGSFLNQKDMGTHGKQTLVVSGHLLNDKGAQILGEEALAIQGEGRVDNFGSVSSQTSLSVTNKHFENHHLLQTAGTFQLAPTERFVNKNTGTVLAKGKTTIEGVGVIINEAPTTTDAGMGFAGQVHFRNFDGELMNAGHFNSAAHMEGTIKRLVNHGIFGANKGFKNLAVLDLLNEIGGRILGDGILTVTGENKGLIQGKSLVLTVEDDLTNTESGMIKADDRLETRGFGRVNQKGSIETSHFTINNARFENFAQVYQEQMTLVVGSNVSYWKNHKGGTLKVKDMTFERALSSTQTTLNEGTVSTGKLINRRQSFINTSSMYLGQWHQLGASFTNEEDASVDVSDLSEFDTDTVDNRGTLTFKKEVKGRIKELLNKKKLMALGDVHLTGTKLLNGKGAAFTAKSLFDWRGEMIENRGRMALFDNHALVRKQLINTELILWTHNSFRASHVLNLGWMERTQLLEGVAPSFTVASDQSTTFKDLTVENRGTLKMVPTDYVPRMDLKRKAHFQHWQNSGEMKIRALHLQAKSFQNTGELGLVGDITGSVESFTNAGKLLSQGSFAVTGQTLTNTGDFKTQKGMSYNGKTFTSSDTAKLLTGGHLDLATSEPLVLRGILQGDQGATFAAPQITSHKKVHVQKGKAEFKGKLTNHGAIDVDELIYEGEELLNTGTLEANIYKRLAKLQKLTNQGTFVVRKGGFSVGDLKNSGPLQLHDGLYTFDTWDNEGGTADIDQLSILASHLVLRGKLDATMFVVGKKTSWYDTSKTYDSIKVEGETTFRGGEFETYQLENFADFVLGAGQYKVVGTLTNHPKSKLTLHERMIQTHNIMNDGEIFVPTSLEWTDVNSYYTRIGKFEVAGDLKLHFKRGADATPFLYYLNSPFYPPAKIGKTITITADKFLGTHGKIVVPNSIVLTVSSFFNEGEFVTRGLELVTDTFRNGESNDRMGTLEIHGPLTITSKGDVDNRFGVIKSSKTGTFKSLTGSVLVGASKDSLETLEDRDEGTTFVSTHTLNVLRPNGAKITSAEDIVVRAPGALNTSFGVLYGSTGVSAITRQKIINQSGYIESAGDINLTAPILDNLIGDVFDFAGHDVDCGGLGLVGRTRKHVKSGPGFIRTTAGDIFLKVRQGRNVGSQILASKNVFYHEGEGVGGRYTLDKPTSLESVEQPLGVSVYLKAAGPYFHSMAKTSEAGTTVPAFIRGGERVDIDTADFKLTGSISAPLLTLKGRRFFAQNTGGQRGNNVPEMNIIIDLGKVVEHMMKNHPLLVGAIAQGEGVRLDLLGDEKPLPFDPDNLPIIRSPGISPAMVGSARLLLSPEVLRFTVMYALSQYLGTLNVYGKSGDELLYELYKKSKEREKAAHKEGQLIPQSSLGSFEEGMIFYEIQRIADQLYKVPQLLATPDMHNPLGNEPGSATGHTTNIDYTEDVTLVDSAISGRDQVHVTSAGTMHLRREKQTRTRQEWNTTLVEDIAHCGVLIESQQGDAADAVKVMSVDTLYAQAPTVFAPEGGIEFGSSHADVKVEQVVLGRTETTVDRQTKSGGGGLLGGDDVTISETKVRQTQTAVGATFKSRKRALLRAGVHGTFSVELPTIQTVEGIHFQGKHLDLKGAGLVDRNSSTRTQTGGRDTFGFGGATREAETVDETAVLLKGQLATLGDIILEVETATMVGIDRYWGGTFYDYTHQFDDLPLEVVTHSTSRESRSGWKGDAASSTVIRQGIVLPGVMQGPRLHLESHFGLGGETHFRSTVIDISDETIAHKAIRESTAVNWVEQTTTSTSDGSKSLSAPQLGFTRPKFSGATGMDRLASGLEGMTANMSLINTGYKGWDALMSGSPWQIAQLIGGQVGTWSHTTSQQESRLYQSEDAPVMARWGRVQFINTPFVHLKGHNTAQSITGHIGQLSSEPLEQVKIFDLRGQSETQSANGFSLSFGFSESSFTQKVESHKHTNTTLRLEEASDLVVEGNADLTGLKVTGKSLELEVMGNMTGASVPDTYHEETQSSHFGVNVNLGGVALSIATGNPMGLMDMAGIVTPSLGEDERVVHRTAVGDRAGIEMLEHLKVKVHGHLDQASFDIKGPETETSVEAESRSIREIAPTESIQESHSTFGAVLRVATAGLTFTQVGGALLENLNRTFATGNIKQHTLEELQGEGIEAKEGIEVLENTKVKKSYEELGEAAYELEQHLNQIAAEEGREKAVAKAVAKPKVETASSITGDRIPSLTASIYDDLGVQTQAVDPLSSVSLVAGSTAQQAKTAHLMGKVLNGVAGLTESLGDYAHGVATRNPRLAKAVCKVLETAGHAEHLVNLVGASIQRFGGEEGHSAEAYKQFYQNANHYDESGSQAAKSWASERLQSTFSLDARQAGAMVMLGGFLGDYLTGRGAKGLAAGKLVMQKGAQVAERRATNKLAHAGKQEAGGAINKAPYNPRAMETLLKEKYGADAVSSSTLPDLSKPNVKLAGKSLTLENGTRIPFDQRGYPIFDSFLQHEVKLPSQLYQASRNVHFRKSTKSLRESIKKGEVNPGVFNKEQLEAIMAGKPKIPDYTWHHHQDFGRLQLIPNHIHSAVSHTGGASLWGIK